MHKYLSGLLIIGIMFCGASTASAGLFKKKAKEVPISIKNEKHLKDIGPLALTSCNVLFGSKTLGLSEARPGLGASASRNEGTYKKAFTFILEGIDDTQLQSITEQLCDNIPDALKAKGFEVVDKATVRNHALFKEVHAQGKASPYKWKLKNQTYTVFSPEGMTAFDQRYLGIGSQLAQGLKNIKGENPDKLEKLYIHETGYTAVHASFLVDFAKTKSAKTKGLIGLIGGQHSNKIESTIQLSVTGNLGLISPSSMKCKEYSTRTDCTANWRKPPPEINSGNTFVSGEKFYTEMHDIQSKGDKAGEALVNVLGFVKGALGGGGTSINIKETGVIVDPEIYSKLSTQMSADFMNQAAELLKTSAK